MAPDHIGRTTQAQPTIYWYLSASSHVRVDVTLIDDRNIVPIIELQLSPPVASGFHVLDLKAHGLVLEEGRVYEVYAALVPNPDRRSHDVIASGAIERIEPIKISRTAEPVDHLAGRGVWYDAFELAQRQVELHPRDTNALAIRNALIDQVAPDQP
jgi:hypothetical protein